MGMVTSLFARKMVAAAGPSVDAAQLLASVGLAPDVAWDPKAMLPDVAYYDLLEEIATQVDVTDLPLRTGASMRCDDYGALGLAWKAAPTLSGSFERVARYARLWTNVVEYERKPDARGIYFCLHREGSRRLGLRLSNEASLASAIAISREVSPIHVTPIEVFFKHQAPSTTRFHQEYFGCPVTFGADKDALLISREQLELPNQLGDEGITRFLLSYLERELAEVAQDATLEEQTKDAIARSLSGGLPKMVQIAKSLGLSARSFHRRLAEHGLSFQRLTETTRRELAEGLLRDEAYSLAEIAFLTGFSEQSSFTRAFKRWVGQTPAHYRRSQT